ncbi:TlpA disulfide reductase family protein [Algoriphagus halophytocola]|uniref:AhpC/TSA family protein n=1 Tax=Algoriphagus halophytocola TaxID=2991499 RepID=A0ABY6MIJ9_9BACT|nr:MULTISPECIES: TlpA disulfide reductase family protein [unclassified Algoriphagus]UZD23618.1 AhpC/TSA family protein [Algoriphagus sp. TR-M5]WBL44911.1 TlpA disulfide reductase family protein [Algoriphagus sp. TR-M9]
MLNRINAIALLLIFSFSACSEKEVKNDGTVTISGTLENAPGGDIILSQFTDTRPKVLDTLTLDDKGSFEYQVSVDTPTFYELNLYGQKSVRLALLNEDVQVNYDFSSPESLVIEGSKDSQEMVKIEKMMEAYQTKVNALNEAYYEAMSENDSERIKEIQAEAMLLESNQASEVKNVINSMGDSFASLAAIGLINPKNEFQFIDSLVAKLDEKYPETKSIIQLKQQLDEMRALSMGQVAPEIELTNPQGELIKLSDFRGKYVMIDFWAAWCKPCREENPNVVKLYNQYKDQGFEVFGVSLDRTKEAWVQAIEEDGLTWTQVSDLKYFNSVAAETYQINAIPATYLLDPDGKIIAKDLRGPSLRAKLEEIFN